MAFRDINPQAPTHVLVVPRDHQPNAAATAAADPEALGRLVAAAAEVADRRGSTDYRLVLNTGAGAGQSVFHVHLHVLGGRSWAGPRAERPPGRPAESPVGPSERRLA